MFLDVLRFEEEATSSGFSADAARMIAIGIGMLVFAAVGIAEGWAVATALKGMARNPEAAGKLRSSMIIGVALVETEAIYALGVLILMLFVA